MYAKMYLLQDVHKVKSRKVGLVDVQRKRLSIRQSYSNMTLFWYHVVGNSSFGIPVYHPYGRFDCPRSLGWVTRDMRCWTCWTWDFFIFCSTSIHQRVETNTSIHPFDH